MTIQENLKYNWERRVFTLLRGKFNRYIVVTAPYKDGDQDGLLYTQPYDTKEEAKANAFSCEFVLKWDNPDFEKNWLIEETFSPLELMGKGFQVGDKVQINLKGDDCEGMYGNIETIFNDGTLLNVRVQTGLLLEHLISKDLKPVLPFEEEDKYSEDCRYCKKHFNDIRTHNFSDCYHITEAIKTLENNGIIKDGKIINL